MKKLLPALLFALLAAALFSSPANAASAKLCRTAGTFYNGEITLADVTAKNLSCVKARRFVRSFTRNSGAESGYTCSEDFYCDWRGWQCRNDGRHGDVAHRCETIGAGKRITVVRWTDRMS